MIALTLAVVSSSSVYAASYKVKSGDTLYKVGRAYKTTTNALIKDNGLKSSIIYTGQLLAVPTNTYNVISGDTLSEIAKQHNISLDNLRTTNDKSNDTIHPGEVLKIPTPSAKQQVVPQKNTESVKHSNSDLDLLARLITAEAVGESDDAMLSVGAVVINRVQSLKFPNTINGVINEKSDKYYQFTPVENGMINKTASKAALNAASEALKGKDPTNGALYFYDNTVTNKWLTSKPVATSKGKLTFAF